MKTIKLILFSVLIFSACNRINKQIIYKNFDDSNWLSAVKVNLVFNKTENIKGSKGDIYIMIDYSNDVTNDPIPIVMSIKAPNGEHRIIKLNIKLFDENNKQKGEKIEDYFKYHKLVWENYNFNQVGCYTIAIESIYPYHSIIGVKGIGVVIK